MASTGTYLTDDSQAPAGRVSAATRALMAHRLALIGLIAIVLVTLFSFVGPFLYHTNQVSTNLMAANLPPGSARHPLGTTSLGYDQLGRLMVGGQSSIEVGVSAGLLATFFGAAWGAVAGFVGGVVDTLMMRIVDAWLSVPGLFLLLVIGAIWRPTIPSLILIIALIAWLIPARLVRAETLSLRTRDYVLAVRVMGGRRDRAVLRHILPNAIGTVAVTASFKVADAILYLAYLSYLGLGVSPPATNWGGMLANGIRYTYAGYWWLIYPPGLLILIVVMAFNFLGDGLRDSIDPLLRRR
ncbi:MAG: ABC transporter permease [Acidimicrobiales bacterium]